MAENTNPVVELSRAECVIRLRSQTLGRVVTRVGDIVDIFPVNYALDGEDIVLRTAEGTKLVEMVVGGEVLFEVDHHDDAEAWSVVVRGSARLLDTEVEIAAAEALPLVPMIPTLKRNFVRISSETMSGRAFVRAVEPSRDGPQDY